jgi:hypothetical protein
MHGAAAQAQTVTVRGVVYDSLHSRPLGGAFVAMGAKMTTSDSTGRFTFADVPPGTYRVTAQHDAIDLLGISAIGAQVRVTDGKDPITVALPSFRTMWRQVCGLTPPGLDTGFVFGTVRGASNATVTASWIDIITAGTTVSQKAKIMEVSADSLGNFTLCGVPTTTGLTLRAAVVIDAKDSNGQETLSSGAYDIAPMDQERVARRDITIGRRLSGISGKVLADSGRGPIANAELVLTDIGAVTSSNDRGEYEFTQLPAGSHRLYVRKIGYAEAEMIVELAEAEKRQRDIIMNRVTILDSMQVKAKYTPREEGMRVFEENRRLGLGKFITQAQLDSANGRSLPQFIVQLPAIRVWQERSGPEAGKYKAAWVGRGPKTFGSRGSGSCAMMVFVDGVEVKGYDLNDYPPSAVAGIEYYRGGAQTPPEYSRMNSGCGVIAIHLRR